MAYDERVDALDKLASLKDGWDGYRGSAPTSAALAMCRRLHFTPLSSGGIQIEMHADHGSVEIEVDEFGRLSGVYTNLSTAK